MLPETPSQTQPSAPPESTENTRRRFYRDGGGDSNGESYDLENDASNGWDANEMFRYNEVKYGVTSTYDSSLSMYTVPLEKGNSEVFRQREARAARLASEIESSPQYRHRVGLENDEGKSEEDKYSAVVRDGGDRERGRESPRDRERERGRDSPGAGNREGKYIPLPQRQREMNRERERAERDLHCLLLLGPSPVPPPQRETARCQAEAGPTLPTTPRVAQAQAQALALQARTHLPHQEDRHPLSARTSPKAQRPPQSSRTVRAANSHAQSAATRSPKSGPSQDTPYLDTSSVSLPPQKTSGPAPLFPVDVNEILGAAALERSAESPSSTEESKNSKGLPQFSKGRRLKSCGNSERNSGSSQVEAARALPALQQQPPLLPSARASHPARPNPLHQTLTPLQSPNQPQPPAPSPSQPQPQPSPAPAEDPTKDAATTPGATTATTSAPISDRHSPAVPQPARTPGSDDARSDTTERPEGVADQVKKSTLNPNAKEFNPIKPQIPMTKPNTAPTPPRPTPPSPVVLQHPGGQGPLYNTPYLSYIQTPQMYQYTMASVPQGKYPRTKGSVVAQRSDHGTSATPMLQAAASAAGAPLVASPYPQSYLQYTPQQYGQQQVMAMTPFTGQQMYPTMVQGGARIIGQGGGPHPPAVGPPGGPQFPSQGEGPQGPQQGIYAQQSFSHHSGAVHQPQPSSTPTGNQPPPQHAAPSPGQNAQSGPQPQPLYHSGPLSAPTPPNMPPGHTSPQGSYIQGYSIHQGNPLAYPLGQMQQAHIQGAMSGPHHSGGHGQHQVMMLQHPPQQGPGSVPQHPQHGPQQGAHQHFYIGHPQAMQRHEAPRWADQSERKRHG
ncbi:Ataxin-2-like protein Ataxin-2 domain protein Ataxin-2-related protein [Larimichthys crocea]|uniref:Ataxin-2-like protein Ataxin-2 domain protein Ataxin-2-related protein n=1 Tax=Larimichthys crocea TaxID=215358 RepID=A0A6G0HE69_LARCR|nr:Ataxin-2-like protein Ataxin-2 domain protein Ataxin-2-related protein [Larimichthys crocea]